MTYAAALKVAQEKKRFLNCKQLKMDIANSNYAADKLRKNGVPYAEELQAVLLQACILADKIDTHLKSKKKS